MINVRQQGFTLIEIIVVVAIVGILVAIAVPSYQESVKKTRRIDAQAALLSFAAAMERHYTINSSYLGADDGADANGSIPDSDVFASEAPVDGGTKFYDLRMQFTTLTYTVFAFPKGVQASDGAFSLSSANERRWDKDNNDSFSHGW